MIPASPSLSDALAHVRPGDRIGVVTGPLGGGRIFVVALLGRPPMESIDRPTDIRAEGDVRVEAEDCVVLDRSRHAGLGPAAGQHLDDGDPRTLVLIEREEPVGIDHLLDLTADADLGQRVWAELASSCAVPGDIAAAASASWGSATVLLDEAVTQTDRGLRSDDPHTWVRHSPALRAARAEVADGGDRLLDLGRVLTLLAPAPLEVGDEWPQLASALSGRQLTVGDLHVVLNRYPGLVRVQQRGTRVALLTSAAAATLLSGDIPVSPSEHYGLFRALRSRAVAVLSRKDTADAFIAHHLPAQAAAAGALAELVADGAAVLCSEPEALVRALEGDRATSTTAESKAVLLAAHRLRPREDAASQLELSARRLGLNELAEGIGSAVPRRVWRPVWATSQAVHTHRVLRNRHAAALALSAPTPDGAAFYAGYSDGAVWELDVFGGGRECWTTPQPAEVRAISLGEIDGGPCLALATSDHVVRAIDPVAGRELWVDRTAHADPLSAVTVVPQGAEAPALVISSGVGGRLVRHQLLGGARLEDLITPGAEVRALRAALAGGRRLLALCRVNGWIELVDVDDGAVLLADQLSGEVCNALALSVAPERIRIAVGTSSGRLVVLERHPSTEAVTRREFPLPGPAAVNGLTFASDADIVVARANGTWSTVKLAGEVGNPFAGHVGPVNAITVVDSPLGRRVVTVGGEGACRLWDEDRIRPERLAYERVTRHQGAVTSIALQDGPGGLAVLTGGSDGDVRGWLAATDDGSVVSQHDGEVTAISLASPQGTVAAAADGSVRLLRPDGSRTLLGMAHEGVHAALVDGDFLWTTGADGGLTRWDLRTAEAVATAAISRYGSGQALAMMHRRGLALGRQDGKITIVDPVSLAVRRTVDLDVSVTGLAAVPNADGPLIAALGDGRIVLLSEFGANPLPRNYIAAHSGETRAVVCLRVPGHVLVASTGLDRRIRVADLQTGHVIVDVEIDGYGLALAAAGPMLALGTSVGAAVLRLDPTAPLRQTGVGGAG